MHKTGFKRRKSGITQTHYPTNITDEQWGRVRNILPRPKNRGRPRRNDLREIVNAMAYWSKNNTTLRQLPPDFPPWGSVWYYIYSWQRTGLLEPILQAINDPSLTKMVHKKMSRSIHQKPEEIEQHRKKLEHHYEGNYQQLQQRISQLQKKLS